MRTQIQRAVAALLCLWLAAPAFAQELFIYPQEGQSREQQELDEFECFRWARDRTGFDPMETPRATSAAPQQSGPSPIGGAIAGAAVGSIVGNARRGRGGRGAARGAAAGGMIASLNRNSQAQAQDDWARDQARQYQRRRNEYNRAFAACLEGRGYRVR